MRPDSEKVIIGYLRPKQVEGVFMESVLSAVLWDSAGKRRVVDGGGVLPYIAGCNLSAPRNELVKKFLAYGQADWLWMVDTDMSFTPDTLERLLEYADPATAPIVGGLCFALNDKGDIVPTMFGLVGDDASDLEVTRYDNWPPDAMFQVEATGAACLLVHRSVFERMLEFEHPGRPGKRGFNDAYPWFQELEHNGRPVSEDIAFCWRAGLLHIPVFVNTAVQLGHVKDRLLTAEAYQVQRDFNTIAAEGDVDPTAVLVPVMRRPANAAPFMAGIKETAPTTAVYALADAGDEDTIAAWREAGATVMIRRYGTTALTPGGTFAQKVNFGYRETTEPWLFLVGDDVKFTPGWLEEAFRVARETGARVVGTNDLGNEMVTTGQHATHLLINRSYIDEVGASWDGPGIVCHEGYRHWFIDNEIVVAAKQREAWVHATDSIVEHLHPLFGKADSDAVYELGNSHAEHDKEVWAKRVADHA